MYNIVTKSKEEVKEAVKKGVNYVYDIVGSTMGAYGATVIYRNDYGQPVATKDGVTVAKNLFHEDPMVDNIVQIVKQASISTATLVGDGPQPLTAKVYTPTGYKTMGKLCKGDTILTPTGNKQNVLEVFDKGEMPVYEVHFSGGRKVECSLNHLWEVFEEGNKKVVTLEYILNRGLTRAFNKGKKGKEGKVSRFYVQRGIADFEPQSELPLDPYLLGVLLGDGCLKDSGSIELSLGNKKSHILDKLVLPQGVTLHTTNAGKNSLRVKLCTNGEGNIMRELLEGIGLRDKVSFDKFIPAQYLYSPKKDRLALLQGIIDTDGHVNKRGLFEISTVSASLKEGIVELCESLGLSITYTLHERTENEGSYSKNPIYRIVQRNGYKYGEKIVSIVDTGRVEPMRCIKVSGEDSLYLTDNYIVTHNTTSSIALAKGFVDTIEDIVEAEKEVNWLMGEIDKYSKDVTTLDEVEAIASVSSNDDKVITKAIRDAYELCGLDGTVQLGYEKVLGTHLKHTKGVTIQAGMASRYFSNNPQTSEAKYADCALLLINSDKLPQVEKFNNVVVSCGQAKLPLIIIVDTIKMDVISSVAYHAINAKVAQICVIQTNQQGTKKETLYKDLSNAFNTPVLNDSNIDALLPKMNPETLGKCSSFVADMESTTLVPEKVNSEYIEVLKRELAEETNVAVKEYIESRISMMTASVVTVNCGAETMAEAMELRDRLEDAIFAVKSAIKGGYVAGAGNMLAHLSTKCSPNIAKALLVPQRTIYGNAGLTFVEHTEYNKGLNLRTMEVCDLCEAGIIDPTLVVKTSLKSAFSAVRTLLTTNVIFYNKLVDKQ